MMTETSRIVECINENLMHLTLFDVIVISWNDSVQVSWQYVKLISHMFMIFCDIFATLSRPEWLLHLSSDITYQLLVIMISELTLSVSFFSLSNCHIGTAYFLSPLIFHFDKTPNQFIPFDKPRYFHFFLGCIRTTPMKSRNRLRCDEYSRIPNFYWLSSIVFNAPDFVICEL